MSYQFSSSVDTPRLRHCIIQYMPCQDVPRVRSHWASRGLALTPSLDTVYLVNNDSYHEIQSLDQCPIREVDIQDAKTTPNTGALSDTQARLEQQKISRVTCLQEFGTSLHNRVWGKGC